MAAAPLRQVLLDGQWSIVLDPDNEGRRAEWYAAPGPPEGALPIVVPSCWETVRPGYDGVAWYWHRLKAPAPPPNGTTLLRFDAVNYLSEVWIDGAHVGSHEGGYTPFSLDVTDFVQGEGEHVLVVRVLAPPRDGVGMDGIVLKETPCWRQSESYNFGGIWQSVRLLTLPAVHIADVFIQPKQSLDGVLVALDLKSRIGPSDAEVHFELACWSQPDQRLYEHTHRVEVGDGQSRLSFDLPISDPRPWSPEDPHLYVLMVRVTAMTKNGAIRDEVGVRFGLRWFTCQRGQFHLNGEPVFVKGGFHEGLYPMGLVVPPSREFVVSELQKAKGAGFNLLRYWQIPIHPRILDVADEVGVMLCDEPPIEWMIQTDRTVRLCEEEVKGLVLRDRNHPSVVMWCILNEGGVWWYERGPVEEEIAEAPIPKARDGLCRLARQLDPTRLIIDESGGWIAGATMYLPDLTDGRPISDIHRYERAPTSEEVLHRFRSLGESTVRLGMCHISAGAPLFITEFGYGSVPDLVKVVEQYQKMAAEGLEDYEHHRELLKSLQEGFRKYRMERFFSSVGELCAATQEIHAEGNYLQAMAIRANPLAAGYVMHAFSAGGCIIGAEAFDMWRNEKAVARTIAEANRPCLLSVFLSRCSVETDQTTQAEVVLVNEGNARVSQTLRLIVNGPDGAESEVTLGDMDAPQGVAKLWSGDVPLGETPGQYNLEFILGRPDKPLAKGRRTVWALPPLRKGPAGSIAVVGGEGQEGVMEGLARAGVQCTNDPDGASQVVAVIEGMSDEALSGLRKLAAGAKRLLVLASTPPGRIRRLLNLFGLSGEVRPAIGNWSPVSHFANQTALLDGLPQDRLLGQAYADVMPQYCVLPFQADTLAGCFSYQRRIFLGNQTEFWWGSTISEHPVGRGSLVLCTFRLADKLAADPVAKRLLINMLKMGDREGA